MMYRWIHGFAFLVLIPFLWPGTGTWFLAKGHWWAAIFARSALIAYLLTPASAWIARRFGILDYPETRKLHKEPIPRIGGLAIFLTILFLGLTFMHRSHQLTGLLISSSLLYLLGLWDDIRPLPATVRLWAQILFAGIAIFFGIRVTFIPPMPGEFVIECIITVIWFIGISNAFNFLDGIDGLAAGLGMTCALLFFIIAWETRQSALAFMTVSLMGACLGYLPLNWNPARIYLGDSGSTLIGFLLAGIAVMGSWAVENPIVALSTPLLILSIPIFDMFYTTLSRIKNKRVRTVKEWLEYTGKDHFHHRLLNLGLNSPQATLFILMVNICLGLSALEARRTESQFDAGLLMLQAAIIFGLITVLMLLGRDHVVGFRYLMKQRNKEETP